MADFNRQITGYQIVKRALTVTGVPVPTSVAGSTDAIAIQAWALLTELGQEALSDFDWQVKTKTWTITTIPGTKLYDFPEDLDKVIDQTAWNNTSRLPIIGPMTAQEWAYLVARQMGGTTLQLQWRFAGDQLELYYSPSTPCTINFTYISRGWVKDATTGNFKDTMEADADICLLDPRMMIAMLRFRWRRAKGFDTTDLEREYEIAKSAAQNADVPGRDLSLSNMGWGDQYLGFKNIPDTGYGGA